MQSEAADASVHRIRGTQADRPIRELRQRGLDLDLHRFHEEVVRKADQGIATDLSEQRFGNSEFRL